MYFKLANLKSYKSKLSHSHYIHLSNTLQDLKNKQALHLTKPIVTIDDRGGLHMKYEDSNPPRQTLKNIYLPNDTRLLYLCGRVLRNDTYRSHVHNYKCSICSNSV